MMDIITFISISLPKRNAASEKYHLLLEEMLHNERQADIRHEEDLKRQGEEATHRVCDSYLL